MSALDQMRTAFRSFAQTAGPADAQDLRLISGALDRISARVQAAAVPPGDAPERLDRLIDLAGPRDAAELLRRIRADLETAAAQIQAALPQADRAGLRNATHVLMAVAGSVGALGLESQSRALNALAHEDPLPEGRAEAQARLEQMARPVLAGIARLTLCISRREGQWT